VTPTMRLVCAVPLLSMLACGDGDPAETYTLRFTGDPARVALLLAQDGDGVWLPVTRDASGAGEVEITRGFHGVISACQSAGTPPVSRINVRYEAGAPDQPRPLCSTSPGVTLSGTVTPADAEVAVDIIGPWPTSAGAFDLRTLAGTHDIVAVAGARVLIRRDEDLTTSRTVALDVASDGFALPSVPITVTGAGADPVTVLSELLTANQTWIWLPGADGAAPLVPAARRQPGDRVVVAADLATASGRRREQRELAADSDVAPPLAFGPAPILTVTRAGFDWDGDGDWTNVSVRTAGLGTLSISAVSSGAWRAARGAEPVPWIDVTTLPGWDPSWPSWAAGTELSWRLTVGTGDLNGDLSTTSASGQLTW